MAAGDDQMRAFRFKRYIDPFPVPCFCNLIMIGLCELAGLRTSSSSVCRMSTALDDLSTMQNLSREGHTEE
jgi:hypothetical protein